METLINKTKLTFEAISETETKAIVVREGKTYTTRVSHASSNDIAEFKTWKEKYLSENKFFV
ncbi:MAG: hypothetical protein WC264_02160 [Candidatus Paceibacterota bacterium]|jgi:hypothetical protein